MLLLYSSPSSFGTGGDFSVRGTVPDRVMVFIDYQNVHGWARRKFHPPSVDPAVGQIDPLRLGQLIVSRRARTSELEGVRVYRGRPNPDHQTQSAAANDRQAAAWERSGKVTVIRRPLRYPGDWPETPAVEKGLDVAIAVDLVRLAMTKSYDAAVLVSSDTDLLPAIEMVYDLCLAHIEVATWQAPTDCASRPLSFPGATTSARRSTRGSKTTTTTPSRSCGKICARSLPHDGSADVATRSGDFLRGMPARSLVSWLEDGRPNAPAPRRS